MTPQLLSVKKPYRDSEASCHEPKILFRKLSEENELKMSQKEVQNCSQEEVQHEVSTSTGTVQKKEEKKSLLNILNLIYIYVFICEIVLLFMLLLWKISGHFMSPPQIFFKATGILEATM